MSTTFEQRAAKEYGTEQGATVLRQANPDASGDIAPDRGLIVPALPDAPRDQPHETPAANPNEVALTIDGVRYHYWTEMSIDRVLDSIDTITIRAPFDSEVAEIRDTFEPFTYKDMTVTVGGEPLFTGTLVSIDPEVNEDSKVLNVSGYAKCGVLNDVTAPASALPLEFNRQTLQDIAAKLCAPFGIDVVFDAPAGSAFERVACDPSRKILEFLTELAQQRGLIISNDAEGNLVFTRTANSPPVARLKQGESPLLNVRPRFNPQNYFSHITGIESSEAGKQGGQHTVKNPHVKAGVRPYNFSVTDADGADVKTATEAKAGRMIGNMASYPIEVATWRDSSDKLWSPGDMLTLTAPDALVYNEYKFTIRAVALRRDATSMTASIELAMPGAFNGEIPETLPWQK